jgi:colicin import membrane protein
MSAETELAVVPPKETALTVFSIANGLDPWLQQVRVKVDEFNKVLPDLKTRKGREAYASMAHQIAKSKNALEAVGKEISAKQKEIPKLIDAERKRVWDTLESWQKEVRKPLDDWQAAEDARAGKHNEGIQRIKDMALFGETPPASVVARVIADLESVEINDTWEEFLPEAAQVKDQTLAKLRTIHAERDKHEAEQAELTRLRLEKEARDKKDNEDRIAREAAEQATKAAEEKARLEREAEEQRVRDEKVAAEKRENDLKLAAAESERKAEQAKREKLEAGQKAERDRLQAIEDQKKAVEKARLDEKARADAAADEILRQQKERQADVAHKSKILGEAKQALISMNISEELAKAIVLKIARGEVPNVSIQF